MQHSETIRQLQQVIETAIAQADTRTKEIIAFQAIQQVDRQPELRERAIAAYQAGELAAWQDEEDNIQAFLVGAIAAWAAE
ncbi:MAG: hypothetical protein ACPGVO_23985 [Spirulinaceae cyanobacterium]